MRPPLRLAALLAALLSTARAADLTLYYNFAEVRGAVAPRR